MTHKENKLTLAAYQEFNKGTDQTSTKSAGFNLALLGLFGEVGSLLSELKKKRRDADSYIGYSSSVIEEFGDVLWYFTNIVTRAGLTLGELWKFVFTDIVAPTNLNKETRALTFDSFLPHGRHIGPVSSSRFEQGALKLAAKVGRLLDDINELQHNSEGLVSHLTEILGLIIHAAEDADISLQVAAEENVYKTTGRWPSRRVYPRLFDRDCPSDEQLPRFFEIEITEVVVGDKSFVVQKCNGIKIGDRLTDNKIEEDDYRFHDVFHLAYAAKLGWSPVIRSLFRLKRKSKPKIDENEDGARAILIEEGVSTYVFNHGLRLNHFRNIEALDYALLKFIKELVQGYEVQTAPVWLWEEAVLEGFRIFRFLKKNRKGVVSIDLNNHTIDVRKLNAREKAVYRSKTTRATA